MKRTSAFVLVLFLCASIGVVGVQAQDDGDELLANGDFSQGLAYWEIEQHCSNCWMDVVLYTPARPDVLAWERSDSNREGAAIWARQSLSLDVSGMDHLVLNMEVRLGSHTLPNSGWWSDQHGGSGEYPLKVSLMFTDAQGNPFEWSYGFLINHDGTTSLSNYTLLPAGDWTPLETDIFSPFQWRDARGEILPAPVMLTDFRIGGNGWDFAAAVDSLQLRGNLTSSSEEETSSGGPSDTSSSTCSAHPFIVEEYPIVSAAEDNPDHFEFRQRINPAILAIRRLWREPAAAAQVAYPNQIMAPFGYRLVPSTAGEFADFTYPVYELYHGDTLLVSDVTHVWPIAVSSTGDRFVLLLDSLTQPTLGVTQDTVGIVNQSNFVYIPPVFVGGDLVEVEANWEEGEFILKHGEEILYTVTPTGPFVEPPVKALWAWDTHWVLEVDGEVIIDGQSLNQQLGYDEIFAWQLLDGYPFFFFKKNGHIGVSYCGEELAYQYDDVVHYACCEPSMFNVSGNQTMVWFYALRDGLWYYVEMGPYPPLPGD
jgi:hypothetical protein